MLAYETVYSVCSLAHAAVLFRFHGYTILVILSFMSRKHCGQPGFLGLLLLVFLPCFPLCSLSVICRYSTVGIQPWSGHAIISQYLHFIRLVFRDGTQESITTQIPHASTVTKLPEHSNSQSKVKCHSAGLEARGAGGLSGPNHAQRRLPEYNFTGSAILHAVLEIC